MASLTFIVVALLLPLRLSGFSMPASPVPTTNRAIVFDEEQCIKCGRCASICSKQQGIEAIKLIKGPGPKDRNIVFDPNKCIKCGQCTVACPTAAIHEWYDMVDVLGSLSDSSKIKVATVAPSVRVAIAEEFGLEPGQVNINQVFEGLKKLGFDYVFDTNFAADLTIMEEGTELVDRLTKGGTLPMFTSCCPGWVNMVENFYPELIPHLSSCKSPQGMMGAVVKNVFSKKIKRAPEDIVLVSVMPCTAKKDEFRRPDDWNIDFVITTREVSQLFKDHDIDIPSLQGMTADHPLQQHTGAGALFGATGGVMEAALRTAYEIISGQPLNPIVYEPVRGLDGVKKATVEVPGVKPITVGVVNGGSNINSFIEKMRSGEPEAQFDFVEFMACPGGCIGGGGQPRNPKKVALEPRMQTIYSLDQRAKIRRSHENPAIQALYKEDLGEPNGHLAHELLHTHYESKKRESD